MSYRKLLLFIFLLSLVTLPLFFARAASGGEITGTVTDTKGAVIVGASITVSDPTSGKELKAKTDAHGRFRVGGLPAGLYTVTIIADGFSEARRENVRVESDKSTSLDVQLEVAPVNAGSVTVKATGAKPNSDPLYQQLRQQSKSVADFSGPYGVVQNLVLNRDAARFTLRSGELYFLTPVEGRTVGAVFIGEGEMSLTPPTEIEKHSLAIFTGQPGLTEEFNHLVLRFTDQTFEDVKQSPNVTMRSGGAQAGRARDLYHDKQTLLRKQLHKNLDIRTLADLYAPARPGYFVAFINGKRFNKLIYMVDPLGDTDVSPEEVSLSSYGDTDGGIWTAFHLADEYKDGTATSAQDRRLFDITHHEIDAAIKGTQLAASDRVSLRALVPGVRVLPFDLYRSLRVNRVQDEQAHDLDFIQESKDEDADLAVILPQPLEVGKSYTFTVEYKGGEALRDSGSGNFILIPRSTWYPNNAGTQFGDRATFDMTFRYPKNYILVGTGEPAAPESREGDLIVSKWTSGQTELAVAGFNYGRFKKKEVMDKETGYQIEFFANEELPDQLRQVQTVGMLSTTGMAGTALAEAQNATRLYSAYFGKLPFTRLAMSQQPAANFGQAWPTLVFMPYSAFMDATQRVQLFGIRGGTDNFWRYVGPHEIAHQWWGHMVGWDSYHDQWMSEGFAEFSTSLYVQFVRKDMDKFNDFWEEQRKRITESRPATKDHKPYTIGPVTQGYRLNSAKTGASYQYLVYPKGAYILHMLRMLMYDRGDARFAEMMRDFIKTHYNKDVSTEDLKQIVEKHMTKMMDLDGNGRMDWFFNEWVYGTEMPSYRFDYQINGNTVSGRITQSGVSDNFRMRVPVYVDFGKGWARLGSASLIGNSSTEVPEIRLPQPPKRVAICALHDVLALSVENNKK